MVLQLALVARPFMAAIRERLREVLILSFAIWFLVVTSHPAMAGASVPALPGTPIETEYVMNAMRDFGALPASEEREPTRTLVVPATAYTSDPWETDNTPFVTASGTTVRHGVLAANFLPIGTRVRIPEVYGDEIFIVEDRMNRRYHKRIDIWMEEKQEARTFGIQDVMIEVF